MSIFRTRLTIIPQIFLLFASFPVLYWAKFCVRLKLTLAPPNKSKFYNTGTNGCFTLQAHFGGTNSARTSCKMIFVSCRCAYRSRPLSEVTQTVPTCTSNCEAPSSTEDVTRPIVREDQPHGTPGCSTRLELPLFGNPCNYTVHKVVAWGPTEDPRDLWPWGLCSARTETDRQNRQPLRGKWAIGWARTDSAWVQDCVALAWHRSK